MSNEKEFKIELKPEVAKGSYSNSLWEWVMIAKFE